MTRPVKRSAARTTGKPPQPPQPPHPRQTEKQRARERQQPRRTRPQGGRATRRATRDRMAYNRAANRDTCMRPDSTTGGAGPGDERRRRRHTCGPAVDVQIKNHSLRERIERGKGFLMIIATTTTTLEILFIVSSFQLLLKIHHSCFRPRADLIPSSARLSWPDVGYLSKWYASRACAKVSVMFSEVTWANNLCFDTCKELRRPR